MPTDVARVGPRRIFLVGFYGAHNLGDEAIRAAIVAAAPTYGANILAIASRDPRDPDPRAVPMHGLGLVRYLRAIVRAERVVLGGGGILKDEGPRIPLELFATALAARLLRREVALVAVGVGPFYTRLGRWLAMATARLATVRTVRDADSARELTALGVARVRLGADPTFGSGGVWTTEAPAAAGARQPRGPGARPRVVVSLRPWFLRAPDRGARQHALRDAVAAALAPLAGAGWQIELLSLYWPRDRDEAVALAADPRLLDPTVPTGELDWAALTDHVRDADLVVAMRYHAVAAAAQAGRPTIALAYEPKVRALAADLGLPSLDVDDPALTDRLAAAVEGATAAPDGARAPAASIADLRRRANLALAMALGPWDDVPAGVPTDNQAR
jgi:polysaccharide pyruvyl transferase WcaK-like protein